MEHTSYLVVTAVAAVANGFSGVVALLRPRAVVERLDARMAELGVPVSWSRFPIGTLKTTGAAGLVAGLAGMSTVGVAAAIGLLLFWVCAVHTHLLARDYRGGAMVAGTFLTVTIAALTVGVAAY
ncbi:DoxX family protein [Aeromicrobium sp. CTD01-1L150]|uniref:DoxX family protein n=1 Tax=Aeromicrobium sp. CTD01-1L150 TaxID=3341830 RepID=UPI0035C0FB27